MMRANKNKQEQQQKIILFAKTDYRNVTRRLGIKTNDRRRHMYLVGRTAMGKTTTLENMIYQDIQSGHGVAVVDPLGNLAEKVINFIPSSRINDVIYFNPADIEHPFGLNVLEDVQAGYRHFLVVSCLVGIFKKIWTDAWSPRLEYVLRNTILALLEHPGSTLLGITRILADKEFRQTIVSQLSDPMVRTFWTKEYPKYPEHLQAEAIAPIQNKLGQFLSAPLVRNIVGQMKSKIDLNEIMNKKKILIMNLSKGIIGEDACAVLGAMMIAKIQMAAMSRINIPENQRRDFYLYIDNFHNFVTDSFAGLLSEAHEYHLNLIIAHQYIGQIASKKSFKIRDAVFDNIGTMVVYGVVDEDAAFLSKKFFRPIKRTGLVDLDKYNVYIKLMIDGVVSKPFLALTLPPISKPEGNKNKIISVSRERYTEPRELIEEKIARWSGLISSPDSRQPQRNKYKSTCDKCGVEIYVPFIPDGVRPVFCKKCLKGFKHKMELENKPAKGISLEQAMKKDPTLFK